MSNAAATLSYLSPPALPAAGFTAAMSSDKKSIILNVTDIALIPRCARVEAGVGARGIGAPERRGGGLGASGLPGCGKPRPRAATPCAPGTPIAGCSLGSWRAAAPAAASVPCSCAPPNHPRPRTRPRSFDAAILGYGLAAPGSFGGIGFVSVTAPAEPRPLGPNNALAAVPMLGVPLGIPSSDILAGWTSPPGFPFGTITAYITPM